MEEDILELITKEVQVKEVYAFFGLALYAAQCLEHGLVNTFLYLELIPSKSSVTKFSDWGNVVDRFADEHFKRTLGTMIQHLKSVTEVSPDLSKKLAGALELRNWLAHRYFRERAKEFLSFDGRTAMIKELNNAVEVFRDADKDLHMVLQSVLDKYGITESYLDQMAKDLFAEQS